MEDEECLEYKAGKVYRLRAPSDGLGKGGIARYPVGLPVKFLSRTGNSFIVQEPDGEEAHFPLRPVWDQAGSIFVLGLQGDDPLLLEEFSSDENAQYVWDLYTSPEKNRWSIDDLRTKMKRGIYSDWECGWSEKGIRNILKAAVLILDEEPQEIIDAIADIALLIYEGDNAGWCEEVSEDEAYTTALQTVMAVQQMLDHSYYVKTGGTWDLKNGEFTHREFKVELREVNG